MLSSRTINKYVKLAPFSRQPGRQRATASAWKLVENKDGVNKQVLVSNEESHIS